MKYFGKPFPSGYPAPIYEDAEQVETPVGMTCGYCGIEIVEGDRGFRFPHYGETNVEELPWHRHCFLVSVLGEKLSNEAEQTAIKEFGDD